MVLAAGWGEEEDKTLEEQKYAIPSHHSVLAGTVKDFFLAHPTHIGVPGRDKGAGTGSGTHMVNTVPSDIVGVGVGFCRAGSPITGVN